jgi:hypothetical protein
MKIVIGNRKFDYNIGCRLLKSKYGNKPFKGLEDIWDDIVPITFKDIAQNITNIEDRRIAIGCLGLENLHKEVGAKLVMKEGIAKSTTWVTPSGELINKSFNDIYELYEVEGSKLSEGSKANSWQKIDNSYFVKFKDTSTDREYMIWVDARSVWNTNRDTNVYVSTPNDWSGVISPIQSIAWTFTTNVPKGQIEKMVRQGDCLLIKKKEGDYNLLNTPRHITETEYRNLLVLES